MKSIGFHRLNNVIFATEYAELVGAFERPMAWPSFSYQSAKLTKVLARFTSCKLILETRDANRGAHLIAQSVTKELRTQSYVAVEFPAWFVETFVYESS